MRTLAFLIIGCAVVITGCAVQNRSTEPYANSERCEPIDENGVAQLFERWNRSLLLGDPQAVVENYARHSILLPTFSNQPRLTPEQKLEYFEHFLMNQPSGEVTLRSIELGCNSVVDSGLYRFSFAGTGRTVDARYSYTYRWDGKKWLITSHHSSVMPERAR